ncbi:hypothetical protein G3M53_19095, partial [Streptomyces sp. SID7982]|nr:hypothetical protein [Streptomyces sp. SID7982]
MPASGGLVGGVEPLAEALGAARRCGAELWVRGGRAMGCTLGRVTRDHGDIDWFTGRTALTASRGNCSGSGAPKYPVRRPRCGAASPRAGWRAASPRSTGTTSAGAWWPRAAGPGPRGRGIRSTAGRGGPA